jgi:hypothetical protein
MTKEALYLPEAPYLHVAEAGVSEITDFGWSLGNHNSLRVVVRFLRGKKMTKLDGLDNEFAAVMQFPWYYGENWAAFDECIKDLSWMSGDVYILIITDSRAVLSEEDEKQFSTLIKILQQAGNEWSQPVETSEWWSRPSIAFHVIFQCDEADKQEVMSRLNSVDASFQELRLQGA